jgi:hypothetical protein
MSYANAEMYKMLLGWLFPWRMLQKQFSACLSTNYYKSIASKINEHTSRREVSLGNGKLVIAFEQTESHLFVMFNVSPLPIQFRVGMWVGVSRMNFSIQEIPQLGKSRQT